MGPASGGPDRATTPCMAAPWSRGSSPQWDAPQHTAGHRAAGQSASPCEPNLPSGSRKRDEDLTDREERKRRRSDQHSDRRDRHERDGNQAAVVAVPPFRDVLARVLHRRLGTSLGPAWTSTDHWGSCGQSCPCCRAIAGEGFGSCFACEAADESVKVATRFATLLPLGDMHQRLEAELMDVMRSRSEEKLKECLERAKPFLPSGFMVMLQAGRRLGDLPSAVDGATEGAMQNGRSIQEARCGGGSDIGTATARVGVARENYIEQVEQGAVPELCTNWPACSGSRDEPMVGHLIWNAEEQLYDRGNVYCMACWEFFRKSSQNIQGMPLGERDAAWWYTCWVGPRKSIGGAPVSDPGNALNRRGNNS